METENLHDIRNEFQNSDLEISSLNPEPIVEFKHWLAQAFEKEVEPTAFSLSTSSEEGKVSSRILLLKEFSEKGFVFFSNYNSRKAKQIDQNNSACMLFYWPNSQKQIRIEGEIHKTDKDLSELYFNSRPIESKKSAIVSRQSEQIESIGFLTEKIRELSSNNIKRPEHWGGYCLKPDYFEFWQGKPNRLHDRFVYEKQALGWKTSRLQP